MKSKQKAKKEKPEAFPSIPKELLAISKKTAFKDETAFNDIEAKKLIDLLTKQQVDSLNTSEESLLCDKCDEV